MTTVPCLEMPNPPELPKLDIPQFGVLEAARQSLYDLPDLSTYLMSMQELASNALAPLRRFLELIEIILAIKSCQEAIIDALLPPSPGPIIECVKDLIKAIARLVSFFPPFEYVKTLLSLDLYIISVIDEVVGLFVFLDERITEAKQGIIQALELGDIDLGAIHDCSGEQAYKLIFNMMDILKYVTPLLSILLAPIARLVPIPELRDMIKSLADIPKTLTNIQSEIGDAQGPPALGSLLEAIVAIRNIASWMYNVLAPVVGRDGDLQPVRLPTLQNF